MLAARQEETDRCELFRKEIAALANELDSETERLASALRARRLEEDELSKAEVRPTRCERGCVLQVEPFVPYRLLKTIILVNSYQVQIKVFNFNNFTHPHPVVAIKYVISPWIILCFV